MRPHPRTALFALTLALAAGCDAGPTGPSPAAPLTPLALGPGTYILSMFGVDCSGPVHGVSIVSVVTLREDGQHWVAGSTSPADGDVELRMRPGEMRFGALTLTGSARGTARDLRVSSVGPVMLTFDGPSGSASIVASSQTLPRPLVSGGISSGAATVVAGSFGTGTCAQAFWGIRSPEGCEIDRSC